MAPGIFFLPYVIHLPLTAARCKLLLFSSANPHEKACQALGPSCMLRPKGSQQGEGYHYHPHESRELKSRRSLRLGRGPVLHFSHRLSLLGLPSLCGSQHRPCLASQGAVPCALPPYRPCLSLHPGGDGHPTVPGRASTSTHAVSFRSCRVPLRQLLHQATSQAQVSNLHHHQLAPAQSLGTKVSFSISARGA